jgi:membrane associated rhomboid family serine protease
VLHAVRNLLSEQQDAWLTALLAFIPARLTGMAHELPGGEIASITQFVTHQFLHGDVTHLLINSAWFLAFGTSVARRTGPVGFVAFFLLCGIAGAALYAALSSNPLSMMAGASGAVSGLMGAAVRFLLRPLREGDADAIAGKTRRPPLTGLRSMLADRRVWVVVTGWTLLNLLMAWAAAGLLGGMDIAWEAHLGGFFMGLLAYGLFDHPPPVHHDGD